MRPGQLAITVVIPTWQRAQWLDGCLGSVSRQVRLPDEVVVVGRREDEPARAVVSGWARRSPFALRWIDVDIPGHMPPIERGILNARGDIVAFLDDDAEAFPDWLERLERHYADPVVAGVGGRYINFDGNNEIKYSVAEEVGKFYWFGKVVGNMYRDTTDDSPRQVDFFMGGNMSYRRAIIGNVRVDFTLNNDVAFHYEVDLGLQVRALGYELIYEPAARIRHFSAPRTRPGLRERGAEAIYWYSHNLLYITLRHVSGWRRWVALAYSFLVGDRTGWGAGAALAESALYLRFGWVLEIRAAVSGKMRALRAVWGASRI